MIGSRDEARAKETAPSSAPGVEGATNEDAVRGVDLAVLAVKADAALDTAPAVAEALGDDPAPLGRERCSPSRRTASGPIRMPARSPSGSRSSSPGPSSPAFTRSLRRTSTPRRPRRTRSSAATTRLRRSSRSRWRGKVVAGRALDAGPLASARTLEGLTAVIVNLNRRYKAHAGITVTGIPASDRDLPGRGAARDRGGRRPRRADRRSGRARTTATWSSWPRRPSRRPRAGSSRSTGSSRRIAHASSPGRRRTCAQLEVILRETARVVRVARRPRDRRDAPRVRLRLGGRRPLERGRARDR